MNLKEKATDEVKLNVTKLPEKWVKLSDVVLAVEELKGLVAINSDKDFMKRPITEAMVIKLIDDVFGREKEKVKVKVKFDG